MEICGKAPMMNEEPTNVVYLSSLLNKQEDVIAHKCDRRCDIEHVWANIYRCKLTGSTHICDKNCNQKIVYDNYSCICRVSHQVFPLTAAEQQAVRGVVRRRAESDLAEGGCASKRRRDAFMHHHQSPFERSFCVVAPICSQPGDSLQVLIAAALFDHVYVACNNGLQGISMVQRSRPAVFLNRKSVRSH